MRIGEFQFKRRYSAAQIVVDIFSVGALIYLGFIIYACCADIERLNQLNHAKADMSMFDWKPLLIWAALGIAVTVFSFVLIFRNKKKPKNLCITKNNVVKYCNIIDTCISCVRLMLIIIISEFCYIHMASILMRTFTFPMIIVYSVLIIACIFIVTRMRLNAISELEQDKKEQEKKTIVED